MESTSAQQHPDTHFNLLRWFSLTALLSVAAVSALSAWGLSAFLTARMIRQDAEITAGFVRSIVATQDAYAHFDGKRAGGGQRLQGLLDHMDRVPGVLRTNVYSTERRILWSSDPSLIGKHFPRNDELEEALNAQLVVHSGIVDPSHLVKAEHEHLAQGTNRFVESYVPVFDGNGSRVLGVVELYKVPIDLFDAIRDGMRMIWLAAAVMGLLLYGALFWIVRRGQRIIAAQRDRLIENESLAVVGEMGSAVAHGLRNPLASIRSSAELALESSLPDEARECATDIVAQVDRLDAWIRQLLTYAKPAANTALAAVDVNGVLDEAADAFGRDLERRHIALRRELTSGLPKVRADAGMLVQLVASLIANSADAVDAGGVITVASRLDRSGLVLAEVRDIGRGITAAEQRRVFKPFFTSKARGLGLGLPLVRRVVERLGGTVQLDSVPGKGTTVRLGLPPWQ